MAMKAMLRTSITDALPSAAAPSVVREEPQLDAQLSRDPEAVRSRGRADKRKQAGFTTLGAWVPDAAKAQFDHLAIDQRVSNAALLLEALNLLFRHHGKPPIARPEN